VQWRKKPFMSILCQTHKPVFELSNWQVWVIITHTNKHKLEDPYYQSFAYVCKLIINHNRAKENPSCFLTLLDGKSHQWLLYEKKNEKQGILRPIWNQGSKP
jgi:hypothetical protein